ncbi:glutamate racemase [Candidatus Marinamargulisbacteria bacterium SCGC AG-439-L15]|nr:glutamate racemase [Candidatus Marinamargulisbacteria bacterium SCGC AG-439-L15]
MSTKKIGIFDSGLGGLTVLKDLHKTFPTDSFVYIADTANAPWGSKSKSDLEYILNEILNELLKEDLKCIVMGCNTSYTFFYHALKNAFPVPLIGLPDFACNDAIKQSQNKRIAILATQGTISTGYFQKTLQNCNPNTEILELASPDLVPFIESHSLDHKDLKKTLLNYLEKIHDFNADCLIYGCTHYPLLDPLISKLTKQPLYRINPTQSLCNYMAPLITNNKDTHTETGSVEFKVSGELSEFETFINTYMKTIKDYTISKFNYDTKKLANQV